MVGPRLPSPEKVSVVRGEKVFNEYCAVCHGLYGKGDGPRYAFFAEDPVHPRSVCRRLHPRSRRRTAARHTRRLAADGRAADRDAAVQIYPAGQ
ncbi:MAG: c-type cytochrome [Rhodoplanes sp.]